MNIKAEILISSQRKERKQIITKRALEYLSLAALGNKNKEIAKILSVELTTVKKTLEGIYIDLKARDRAHAVSIGFMHCLLTVEVLNEVSKKYNLEQNFI